MSSTSTKASPKTSAAKLKKLSKIFDADYYENGISSQKSNYKDYSWTRLGGEFAKTAQHIKNHFIGLTPTPSTLLDVGCAKGFLVFSLRNIGIKAIGIDASEYAISSAPEEVKDFIAHGLVEDLETCREGQFDIVTAFDVLEHLDEKDVPQACKNLLFAADKYIIVCVPTRKVEGDLDVTHKTIKSREWWEEQFRAAGTTMGVSVDVEPIDKYVDKNVWWFNIPEFLIVIKVTQKGN